MDFEDKVLWGGIGVIVAYAILYATDSLNDTTHTIVAGAYIVWLCLHNRITKTIAISSVIGLLGNAVSGVHLGLLLFVVSLTAFWYAWI